MASAAMVWGAAAAVLGIFVPFIGPLIAAGGTLIALSSAQSKIKILTSKQQADVLLLKTLEHYGLIRLLDNNQIHLVNE